MFKKILGMFGKNEIGKITPESAAVRFMVLHHHSDKSIGRGVSRKDMKPVDLFDALIFLVTDPKAEKGFRTWNSYPVWCSDYSFLDTQEKERILDNFLCRFHRELRKEDAVGEEELLKQDEKIAQQYGKLFAEELPQLHVAIEHLVKCSPFPSKQISEIIGFRDLGEAEGTKKWLLRMLEIVSK